MQMHTDVAHGLIRKSSPQNSTYSSRIGKVTVITRNVYYDVMILAPSKREEKRRKWGDRMLDFITILPHGKGKRRE